MDRNNTRGAGGRLRLALAAILLLLAMALTACTTNPPSEGETVYCTVTFDANGGSAVESMRVAARGKISEPIEPIRENYIFDGWYRGTELWRFSYHQVTENITLTARWISADALFTYENIEGTDTVRVTGLKQDGYATLYLPSSLNGFAVTAVGDGAFEGLLAEKVKRVILPDSITEIGDRAFASCIEIPFTVKGELTRVGESAFADCDGLTEVVFGEGLIELSPNAFAGSGLLRVNLPESLEVIGENAFDACGELATVVMYGSLTAGENPIEDSAFRECESLKTIFFHGTEAERDELLAKLANGNNSLEEARFCYYSEEEPVGEGSYWYWHNGEPRVW